MSEAPLHAPATEDEAAGLIAAAHRDGTTLRIAGGDTGHALGRPVQADAVLSTRALSGVLLHEPAELFISARAGTPVRDIEAALAAKGQMLPFEPPDLRALLGSVGEPTIGGVVAGNWSGPRRITAGSARDHVIGVRFVNGRGEAIKSGGRVMKNVTGLDLAKLMCGAYGTLGLVTEVTVKVLPVQPHTATLVYVGLDDGRAIQLLTAALGSPFEVNGAAHLPAGPDGAEARTLLRLQGFAASVDYRLDQLTTLLKAYGVPQRLADESAAALWRDVRDARSLAPAPDEAVWRLSVAPTRGPSVASLVGRARRGRCIFDWGGGLIWLATAAEGDAGAGAVREAVAITGGHATLVRAPDTVRSAVDVFQPLDPALAAITARLKHGFDPGRVLNPGRMYPGC